MTVRWKPLLILSGLFVVVALAGLMAIATVMSSQGTADILARARREAKAKEYEKAKLDYQRALKLAPKDAAIHEEMAGFYDDWSRQAPLEKQLELRGLSLASLASAAKAAPKKVEPRRRMLAEATRLDDRAEQVRWAKELVGLDPNDREAHHVLALVEAEGTSPNLAEVRKHLTVLETETPRRARTEWITARLASLESDNGRLAEILKKSRGMTLPVDADSTDRMALLKIHALDAVEAADPAAASEPIEALAREAVAASAEADIPPSRIARVSMLIEEVQRTLLKRSQDAPDAREAFLKQAEKLDEVADAIFQKSLEAPGGADSSVYLAYADHLRFRDRRDRCLDVALQGLKSPAAARQAGSENTLSLHALAVEASLANVKDKDRHEPGDAPRQGAAGVPRTPGIQALGHLFQGAIDLEKAGLVADAPRPGEIDKADQGKLRASALGHLKKAAAQLPDLAEAQARYGVALILNQEPAMGRQYLQLAQRLGNLEPQYQIWTAWSVVQAGYPEDAEPIVARLNEDLEQAGSPGEDLRRDPAPAQRRDPPGPEARRPTSRRRSRSMAGPSANGRTSPPPSSFGWPRSR